jgi:UrcA family protein
VNTLSTSNRGYSLLAAALFGVFASSFAALQAAADSFDPLHVTVKFGDLDVSQPQGATVLYRRIRAAAEAVCSPYDRSDLESKRRLSVCVKNATADAITTVNQPALSAVYVEKSGKTLPVRVASLHNR